jgi:cytochrome c-type biogenesis protein
VDAGALTIPLVLLAGVVSFASPCFLPVVPVFVGYMTGGRHRPATESPRITSGDGRPGEAARLSGAAHALIFMAAFGAVFAALWALVGLIGWAAADYRTGLRYAGGAALVVLGLQVAGAIRLPFLDRNLKPGYAPDGGQPPSVRRSVLLGLAFGAGWTPCIGPVLGGVLGLTAAAATVGQGLGLLAVYVLGLGLPFVLVSAGVTGVAERLRWFVVHRRAVEVVTGALLVGLGFLIITGLLTRLSGLVAFHI